MATTTLEDVKIQRAQIAAQITLLQSELDAFDLVISRMSGEPKPRYTANSQAEMVRGAISKLPDGFTKNDVWSKINEMFEVNDINFNEGDVATVLWRMANKSKELTVVSKGGGGNASRYSVNAK